MNPKNLLNIATSPYLQQHANNPVNWYPWGDDAIETARRENKPILLSIGYAACHWCHVMAHESFEDADTALMMNNHFINIKVDREERPDLDKVYQTAHYFLTRRNGGWPLTVFLSPDDLTPFFSGTYFPREQKYQLPAFREILTTIAKIHQNNASDVKEQNAQLRKALTATLSTKKTSPLNNNPIGLAQQALRQSFDQENGGFGAAPKFPHPTMLEFLLDTKSQLAAVSLKKMANGGIFDQIGGGFFRYSVDAKWRIPHFEKMLYDNAQLLFLYTMAFCEFNLTEFADIARAIADWLTDSMQSHDGGFYSSLDADSEGKEGTYYLWQKSDVEDLLTSDEFHFTRLHYGLDHAPNFEDAWHLYVDEPIDATKTHLLISARQKMAAARAKRIPPFCDRKILTSWNALTIKGMAVAGDILKEPRYITSAQHALKHLQQHAFKDKQLLACVGTDIPAFLDDYAFLLDALLTLLQIRWNTDDLNFAIQLAENLLEQFYDEKDGGFYFTSNREKTILFRPKTIMDEALPSGNGIAVRALLTLGHLTGNTRYLDAAEKTLQYAADMLNQFPAEHGSLVLALKEYLKPHEMIVIRGKTDDITPWRDYCKQQDYFHHSVFAIPDSEDRLPGLLNARKSNNTPTAYVCKGMECLSSISQFDILKKLF